MSLTKNEAVDRAKLIWGADKFESVSPGQGGGWSVFLEGDCSIKEIAGAVHFIDGNGHATCHPHCVAKEDVINKHEAGHTVASVLSDGSMRVRKRDLYTIHRALAYALLHNSRAITRAKKRKTYKPGELACLAAEGGDYKELYNRIKPLVQE